MIERLLEMTSMEVTELGLQIVEGYKRKFFIVTIENLDNGVSHGFEYQTGEAVMEPIKEDVLYCLFSDDGFKDLSVKEFMEELGYDDELVAMETLRKIRDNSEMLEELYTPEEFEAWKEFFQDY